MGEENCLPTVEESTEPPIRAQRSGNDHGPPTTAGHHHHPHAPEEGPPKSLPAAHTLTAAQVAKELGVDTQYVPLPFNSTLQYHSLLLTCSSHGLTATEAESRLRLYGPNKVKGAEGLSLWAILLRQVSNSLTLVCASVYLPPIQCAFLILLGACQHVSLSRLQRLSPSWTCHLSTTCIIRLLQSRVSLESKHRGDCYRHLDVLASYIDTDHYGNTNAAN